jgi:hypothetical protein
MPKPSKIKSTVSEHLIPSSVIPVTAAHSLNGKLSKNETASDGVPSSSSRNNNRKKTSGSVPAVIQSNWASVYQDFVLNSTTPELIRMVADILLYFNGDSGYFEETTVLKVVSYIASRYLHNYYHSFRHAAHVVLNVMHFLLSIRDEYDHYFTTLEKLAMVYSALIHDVDHLGVPNVELIKQKHPHAIRYHDQSVAENHSIAVGLETLEKPGFELWKGWNEEDKLKFRHIIIELVLCTDIADFYKKKVAFIRFDEGFNNNGSNSSSCSSSGSSTLIYKIEEFNYRLPFFMIALRAADVSGSMQSSQTFHIWAKKYFDEVTDAALHGKGSPMDLEAYCNSQIGYMNGHVKMLIDKLRTTSILKDSFSSMLLSNIVMNIEDWKINGKSLFTEWDTDLESKVNNSNVNKGTNNSASNDIEEESQLAVLPVETSRSSRKRKNDSKETVFSPPEAVVAVQQKEEKQPRKKK